MNDTRDDISNEISIWKIAFKFVTVVQFAAHSVHVNTYKITSLHTRLHLGDQRIPARLWTGYPNTLEDFQINNVKICTIQW